MPSWLWPDAPVAALLRRRRSGRAAGGSPPPGIRRTSCRAGSERCRAAGPIFRASPTAQPANSPRVPPPPRSRPRHPARRSVLQHADDSKKRRRDQRMLSTAGAAGKRAQFIQRVSAAARSPARRDASAGCGRQDALPATRRSRPCRSAPDRRRSEHAAGVGAASRAARRHRPRPGGEASASRSRNRSGPARSGSARASALRIEIDRCAEGEAAGRRVTICSCRSQATISNERPRRRPQRTSALGMSAPPVPISSTVIRAREAALPRQCGAPRPPRRACRQTSGSDARRP